jgi:VanZ family protein
MPSSRFNRNFLVVTAIMIIVILYGSLYPFDFRVPPNGIGPLKTFIGTWDKPPGRGDFVSNILLYLPLGVFGSKMLRGHWLVGFVAIVAIGAILSTSVELTQYYDEGRDTAVSDAYANTLGTALGAFVGATFRGSVRLPFVGEVAANPVPAMLLTAWAAYRLYPYVPVIDLHKYWGALKPLVLTPRFDPLHFLHHVAVWLTGAVLIEALAGARRTLLLYPLFVGGVLFLEILIVSKLLSVDEVAGALSAYVAFLLLVGAGLRQRALVVSLVLAAAILAERLAPFQFGPATRAFGWIPFFSFMHGSIDVDVQSFLEKFFLYGNLIWLLVRSGMPLRPAAFLVAAGLFASSWAEIYLPDRSAEITDAILALAIAEVFARMPAEAGANAKPSPVMPAPSIRRL